MWTSRNSAHWTTCLVRWPLSCRRSDSPHPHPGAWGCRRGSGREGSIQGTADTSTSQCDTPGLHGHSHLHTSTHSSIPPAVPVCPAIELHQNRVLLFFIFYSIFIHMKEKNVILLIFSFSLQCFIFISSGCHNAHWLQHCVYC